MCERERGNKREKEIEQREDVREPSASPFHGPIFWYSSYEDLHTRDVSVSDNVTKNIDSLGVLDIFWLNY